MVDYKGLRSLHLKKIADILPGEVFKLDDEEGYISYFLDQTEDGSDLNNALIGDRHCTHCVIDSIVTVLGQYHTTGGYNNRSTCHIGRIEPDHTARA